MNYHGVSESASPFSLLCASRLSGEVCLAFFLLLLLSCSLFYLFSLSPISKGRDPPSSWSSLAEPKSIYVGRGEKRDERESAKNVSTSTSSSSKAKVNGQSGKSLERVFSLSHFSTATTWIALHTHTR